MDVSQLMLVVQAMELNETMVSRLYANYADRFRQWEIFWAVLAAEEEVHARWLKGVTEDLASGVISINAERFDVKAVELFTVYLQQRLEDSKSPDLTISKALRCAFDIENALIEKKLFEIAGEQQERYRDVVRRLKEATEIHRHKLSEALSGEKPAENI